MNRLLQAMLSPVRFAARRPVTTVALMIALAGGAVVGLSKAGIEVLPPT